MDKIVIAVEFRQMTVAGKADCVATKAIGAAHVKEPCAIKEAVDYVKKILASDRLDNVVISFTAEKNWHDELKSRIVRDWPDMPVEVYKWSRPNIRDDFRYETITAREIRKLYLECADIVEEKKEAV